jgi:predicted transcriptional regulator
MGVHKGFKPTIVTKQKITLANIRTWKNPIIKQKRSEGISRAILKGRDRYDLYLESKKLADKNLSSVEIAKKLNISQPSVFNFARYFKDQDLINKLHKIGRINKGLANFKTGQATLYNKLRKEVKEKKIKCEDCGKDITIEIHHIKKQHYVNNYSYVPAEFMNNNPENIKYQCNSCHQKNHYRNYGRRPYILKNINTGKYLKKNEVNI